MSIAHPHEIDAAPEAGELKRHQFTVDEYFAMAEAIDGFDERVELIEGDIIELSPINYPHIKTLRRLVHLLEQHIPSRNFISTQSTVRIDMHSCPDPDIAVMKPMNPEPTGPLPIRDVLLIAEISHTTLRFDRTTKLALYAGAGVPEYWIVNLAEKKIEVYREPVSATKSYAKRITASGDETVAPLAFPECNIRVREVFAD